MLLRCHGSLHGCIRYIEKSVPVCAIRNSRIARPNRIVITIATAIQRREFDRRGDSWAIGEAPARRACLIAGLEMPNAEG